MEFDNNESNYKKLYSKKILGYILLLIVVILTVTSSIWLKYVCSDEKPFLQVYLNNNFLSIYIPIFYLKQFINKDEIKNETSNINQDTNHNKIFHKYTLFLTLMWYFANSFYVFSLNNLTVATCNSVSNVTIVFIILHKLFILKKKISAFLILALTICIGGLSILTISENNNYNQDESKDSLPGLIYCILAAFFYSIYSITLKYFSKRYSNIFDIIKIFGFLGLYNLLIIPIFLLIFHFSGIEIFTLPSWKGLLFILINSIVASMISDLLQSYCITLLKPQIVSFGMNLTIILSYIYDLILGNKQIEFFYILGISLILLSLTLVFLESLRKLKKKAAKLNLFINNN